MLEWLMSNSFFWDEEDSVWYSVGYKQQFKATLDDTFTPHYIDLYIPFGKASNDGRQLWRNVAGSKNKQRLSDKLKEFNVSIGSKINGKIQPVYLAI